MAMIAGAFQRRVDHSAQMASVVHQEERLKLLLMESVISDQLLTTAEAAERLRCSPEHVLRLLASGRLKGSPIGMGSRRRHWRIYESELHRYVDAAGQAAPAILAVLPTPPVRRPAAYRPKILV